MIEKETKFFALDIPRDMFTWNERSKSFDANLPQGVKICVIGIADDLDRRMSSEHNAVRLWCYRYGNTIVGRIAQIMWRDRYQMEESLIGIRYRQIRTYNMPSRANAISEAQATLMSIAMDDEPNIAVITANILNEIQTLA